MSSALLFNLANAYILPFWLIMILLPNRNFTKKVMNSYFFVVPLIGIYLYYLIFTVDPEAAATLANPQLSDIANFFAIEGAAGAGWTHFLAMDLFVGRWIYWQGQSKQIWTAHSLILCLFFGPVGLLSHIITAAIFDKNDDDGSSPDSKKAEDVAPAPAS
ncbi:MAG: ABA4-like family protein [Cyanobacteria bacterium J06607_15]